MKYGAVLLIACLPAAWGQARPNHFNCIGGGVFPCQAQTVSLPATGSLKVTAVNASVFVETWNAPQILVRVAGQGTGAITVTGPATISARGTAPSAVAVMIKLPAGTDLKISTVNGGLSLHGVTGDVTANAVNGGVSIIVGGSWAGQSLVVNAVNGDIAVAVPADCSARVTASATGGTVSGNFPAATGVPGSSRIILAAVKGDITVWTED